MFIVLRQKYGKNMIEYYTYLPHTDTLLASPLFRQKRQQGEMNITKLPHENFNTICTISSLCGNCQDGNLHPSPSSAGRQCGRSAKHQAY